MKYPKDGTPFELDNETISLLYRAVDGARMSVAEHAAAVQAVDYVSAATLVVEPEEEEEPYPVPEYDDNDMENPYPRDREDGEDVTAGIVVEGARYPVLSNGDAVCPECGVTRSPERITDHMMSEHSEDDDSDDEDELTF